MTEIDEAFRFYEAHYDVVGQWLLVPGKKIFLGDNPDKQCRFCDNRPPRVSFRKEAHAIPELLGNRTLFTLYECDECNEIFGQGIENHLGNWSKPLRMLTRIRGKNGVPTIKSTKDGWRIEGMSDRLDIKHERTQPYTVDENKKEITFTLPMDPYIPIAVIKAFVKIGLSLLPEREMSHFSGAKTWVRDPNHKNTLSYGYPIIHTFQPGTWNSNASVCVINRRKSDDVSVPYAFLVLGFGNDFYQVFLPLSDQDQSIYGKQLNLFRYPVPLDIKPSAIGLPLTNIIDLSGTDLITDNAVIATLRYEEAIARQ